MKWNQQESNEHAARLLGELPDDIELAESLWYLETDDPTGTWLAEIAGFDQIDYLAGEDEAWVYLWKDRNMAHFQPTPGMIFYLDWYAYKGREGACCLIQNLRHFYRLALSD